jgi:hypothetical protein
LVLGSVSVVALGLIIGAPASADVLVQGTFSGYTNSMEDDANLFGMASAGYFTLFSRILPVSGTFSYVTDDNGIGVYPSPGLSVYEYRLWPVATINLTINGYTRTVTGTPMPVSYVAGWNDAGYIFSVEAESRSETQTEYANVSYNQPSPFVVDGNINGPFDLTDDTSSPSQYHFWPGDGTQTFVWWVATEVHTTVTELPVPEPTTLTLLASGFATVGMLRRKRRR